MIEPQHACQTLETLAAGIDPRTGEVLPPDHVLNDPAVIRSLAYALLRLRQPPAPIRKAPPNHGKRWTDEDIDELQTLFNVGLTRRQLADRLQRTRGSIESQLSKMGLIAWDGQRYVRLKQPQAASGQGHSS